mgnify:FL=1
MKTLRVVLDTNILMAASRSSRGGSFALLRMLRAGRFTALASVPLMLEYEAALKRPEHLAVGGRTAAMTDAFLDALCLCCEPVDLYYLWRPCARDPADDMVLETAVNGRADRLATFNTGDFGAAARFGLVVVNPRELLQQLQEGQS